MGKIKKVDDRPNFPNLEERINAFWKENNVFEKSVAERSDTDLYKFVDGPPFVSGMPHYGHLLTSIAKDVIPRYWTMKGKKVRRVWGWDCHGLPIEEKVNKQLGIKSSSDIINKVGVEKYIEACREYVLSCSSDWRWYIEKIGRWVDMDNAYYTMSPDFMESVIWGFKKIYEKGLIYKGKRVSLFSTDTSTPVSNFEVAMDADNYRDVEDLSVFVKFQISNKEFLEKYGNGKEIALVAWTTTPWTIPANFALAVNEGADYSLVSYNGENFILANERLAYSFAVENDEIGEAPDKTVVLLNKFKGKDLVGLSYTPVYDFFKEKSNENDFKVYGSQDVVLDEGSGVLHIAPAFGEVDFQMGLKYGISAIADIDQEGRMVVGKWSGIYLREASPMIAEDMEEKGSLLRSLPYVHRLPFYRGENPLIYMAQDAYFINIQKIKDRMLELNMDINWIPGHIKEGRFGKTVATSPDWCISRNRFWATIMPIWKSEDGEELVVGSIAEMAKYTTQLFEKDGKYFFNDKPMDLHKDVCDQIVLEKDGKKFYRVPEVLDCWMDSGSVPFAEYHYPFENENVFEKTPSADFIVEYLGQVRAWFNVLLRLSTIIFDDAAFKNVICTGVLAGNDGRKMSKSYGNYPDPKDVLVNIGGEALRLYLMGSPIMVGDDMNWSDELLKEQIKNILLPLWNTYKYLGIYAGLHDWSPSTVKYAENNVLDRWLKTYMDKVTLQFSSYMEAYTIPPIVKLLQEAVDNISSWYIRRSRDRFAAGDTDALMTLHASLVQLIETFAPLIPFVTEEVYQNLMVEANVEGAKLSVHLEDFPKIGEINEKLLTDMDMVRELSSLGQSIRVTNSLKLRQPLNYVVIPLEDKDLQNIVKDELQVKNVSYAKAPEKSDGFVTQTKESDQNIFVSLDTRITSELKEEGTVNDLTRLIQDFRKKNSLKMGESVSFSYFTDDEELHSLIEKYKEEIMSTTSASSLVYTQKEGTDLKLDGKVLNLAIN